MLVSAHVDSLDPSLSKVLILISHIYKKELALMKLSFVLLYAIF